MTPAAASEDWKQPLLEGRGLSKSFEGNVVLSEVDLEVRPGEVHAIVGENGAGKSTLIKILGGVYPPDAGVLLLEGSERKLRSPREAIANGIVAIHQELSLARHLSTEENIFLGHFPMRFGAIDRSEIRRRTRQLLERLSVEVDAGSARWRTQHRAAADGGDRQGPFLQAKVLILDEPTAVLDQ